MAAAHPEQVVALQARINALGKEVARLLALIYVTGVGLKRAPPRRGSIDGHGPVLVDYDAHAITDEGFGDGEVQH